MRICSACHTEYEPSTRRCTTDGRHLVYTAEFDASGRDPMLGTTVGERYTVTGRLGLGGMGTVYRAEQSPVGREVALKILRRELGHDPETVARFKREAHTLSQLRHPNTVTIFDAGRTEEGLLYLAMELLEGEMLSARIRRLGPMAPEEAVRVAMGVLRSLDEAHAAGIIHRDLKPDNIFLARVHGRPDEAEVVKVVDFGIAKIRDGPRVEGLDPIATQEGTVFGTPRYMSPEQAQGRPIDGRSDLYAVGVLLFHMMTGSAPFTEDDAVVVMAHHIQTVPPRVGELVPEAGVPASLEGLVADALEKDPLRRPQTASDFLSRLESLLPEVKTARLSVVTDARRSPPRPRWGWAALGLGAALTLAVFGSASLLRGRPDAVVTAISAAHQSPDSPAPHDLPPPTRVRPPPPSAAATLPPESPAPERPAPERPAPERPAADPPPVPVTPAVVPSPPATALRPTRRIASHRHRPAPESPAPAAPVALPPSHAGRPSPQPYRRWDD